MPAALALHAAALPACCLPTLLATGVDRAGGHASRRKGACLFLAVRARQHCIPGRLPRRHPRMTRAAQVQLVAGAEDSMGKDHQVLPHARGGACKSAGWTAAHASGFGEPSAATAPTLPSFSWPLAGDHGGPGGGAGDHGGPRGPWGTTGDHGGPQGTTGDHGGPWEPWEPTRKARCNRLIVSGGRVVTPPQWPALRS